MNIRTNILGINASNNLRTNNDKKAKSMEKLSSGLGINRAADDAAGLAISEKMRGQIRGLNQASRNIQDGISVVQTAEGGYQGITDIIQRQRELIIQGMNGTYSDSDKQMIDLEIKQLNGAISSIAEGTSFNTINLLNRNDYQVFADRSSTSTTLTTSDPVTASGYTQIELHPIGTADIPRHLIKTEDTTVTTNSSSNSGSITEIMLPTGETGYNDYNVNVDTTTVTDTHTETYESLSVSYDPEYLKPAAWYTVNANYTPLAPKYFPNLYGQLIENLDVNGSTRALEYTSRTGTDANPAVEFFTFPGTNLSITRSRTVMPDNSLEIKYEITNLDAVDANVKLSSLLDPPSNAVVSDALGNQLNVGNNIINPPSGNQFQIAGDIANATIEFDDALGILAPTDLSISVPASGQPQINFDWDLTLNAGQSLTIGFKYGSFSLNMDVYERTTDWDKAQHIETTTVTNIRDIDFEPPKIRIQTGDTGNDFIKIPLFDASAEGLGITNIGVNPPADPKQSLMKLDTALTTVTGHRGLYGAYQNRFAHTLNNVMNRSENLSAAESRIRDTDMTKQMIEFTRSQIIGEAGQAMLAAANTIPQSVLKLLG
ncbi:flagellin [Cohnella soli]|uniref:Flagellin n=1 Tax=Cohnella soli TaxID=425005 RepID=A0ABW0HPX9_9BACL